MDSLNKKIHEKPSWFFGTKGWTTQSSYSSQLWIIYFSIFLFIAMMFAYDDLEPTIPFLLLIIISLISFILRIKADLMETNTLLIKLIQKLSDTPSENQE